MSNGIVRVPFLSDDTGSAERALRDFVDTILADAGGKPVEWIHAPRILWNRQPPGDNVAQAEYFCHFVA